MSLILENKGLCKDSSSTSVCLISENKLLYPDIITPNGDNCNDDFYLSGLGEFIDFNLKIYNRWGVDIIFESEEKILTDNFTDENICNDNNPYQEYYKMGEWDGFLNNGEEAISGVYVFVVTYYIPNEHQLQTESGNIVLVR